MRSSLSREEVWESWDDWAGCSLVVEPALVFSFLGGSFFGGYCWLGPGEDFYDVGLLLLWGAS